MTTRALVLGVAVYLAGASAAGRSSESAAVATGTAALSGIVVGDDLDARPCGGHGSRARRRRPRASPPSTTRDDSRARLPAGLPGQRHTRRLVTAACGAKRPFAQARPCRSRRPATDIVIRLTRGGVITGTLIDQSGQPAVGASVAARVGDAERRAQARRSQAQSGRSWRVAHLASARRLLRPRLAVERLPPRDVQATSDLDVRLGAVGVECGRPRGPPPGLCLRILPGALALQASPISWSGGGRADVDFALQLVATARIRALTLPDGSPRRRRRK
jgi:hypothetical protein